MVLQVREQISASVDGAIVAGSATTTSNERARDIPTLRISRSTASKLKPLTASTTAGLSRPLNDWTVQWNGAGSAKVAQ